MSFKEATKTSNNVTDSLEFTGQKTSHLSHDSIVRDLPHTFVTVIALDENGDPEAAPTGTYTVYVRSVEDGGFEAVTDGAITGKEAAGSAADDGVAKSVNFSGVINTIKVVPSGETVAKKFKAIVTQYAT